MKPDNFIESPQRILTDVHGYKGRIAESNIFTNTFETILPQTALFDVVNKHFEEKNGKKKKAVIFGWDGARADALPVLPPDSALHRIRQEGGLYLAFTGGITGKWLTFQNTCTAPGWATFMTGKWSDKHTVRTNGGINMSRTLLKAVAKKGYTVRFKYIWSGHDRTYFIEKLFAPDRFRRLPNPEAKGMDYMDARLAEAMISDVGEGADLVFGIFEAPDSFGHKYRFDKDTPEYRTAVEMCDAHAQKILNAIESRPDYQNEDWLCVIISDHGGIGNSHGSQDIECRTVFIDINKKNCFKQSEE